MSFDEPNAPESARLCLPERTTYVWHGCIDGLPPGQLYGYRVHGPFQPDDGLRFNSNKLLIDPYVKAAGRPGGLVRADFSLSARQRRRRPLV